MNDQILREHEMCAHKHSLKCVSWTGILAGALVAVGLSFLLSLFGAAIGLSAFKASSEGVMSIAMGGYIGMLIGTIAVMFFSGWVAGYLTSGMHCCAGALYGLTAWCLALIIMILIATQTMQFVSGNLYYISNHIVTPYSVNHPNFSTATETGYNNSAGYNNHTKAIIGQTVVIDQKNVNLLTTSLFLTFIMFFIGAISSAFGGYHGSRALNKACIMCNLDSTKL